MKKCGDRKEKKSKRSRTENGTPRDDLFMLFKELLR